METANTVGIASFVVPIVFNFSFTFKRLKFNILTVKLKEIIICRNVDIDGRMYYQHFN